MSQHQVAPLTSVVLVLREQDALVGCAHIAEIVSEYLDASHKWSIERAACAGYLPLLDRLGQKELPVSPRELDWALRTAADRGDLAVVQWLTAYQPDMECSTRVMDSAALRGHLSVIKWLHHYRDEGCTTAAMDSAAAYGRLEVIQWLHQNRQEGCTTAAMDSAAAGGHLKTVQWLTMNRTEGCTSVASHFALLNGHMDILRWLNEQNVRVQDTGKAMGGRTPTRWSRRERRLSATGVEAPRHRPRRLSTGLLYRN
uniref:Ankyrin repeat protein n=1 Tax=Peronospora matthiolae TaxID=2874970 RepID=A0AAV1V879_9STRA